MGYIIGYKNFLFLIKKKAFSFLRKARGYTSPTSPTPGNRSKTESLLTYILEKTKGEAGFSGDSSALVFSCSRWARKRAGAALIALTQNERGEIDFF